MSVYPGIPSTSMAWASTARTWVVEYRAIGSGMVLSILTRAMAEAATIDLDVVKRELRARALHIGFGELGITAVEIPEDERHLLRWLEAGFHGDMQYMQRHGTKRSRPQELVPGT